MQTNYQNLVNKIQYLYRRWKKIVIIRGLAFTILSLVSLLAVAYILDSFVPLTLTWRIILLAGTGILPIIIFFKFLVIPLFRAPSKKQIARHVEDKYPELEDRLVSAMELGEQPSERYSPVLLSKLLEDANFRIEPLNLPATIEGKGAFLWGSTALLLSLLFGGLLLTHLDQIADRAFRILKPWKVPELNTRPSLEVTPGNTRIPKGSSQEIIAQVLNSEPEEVDIYYTEKDTIWQKFPMDATEQKGRFAFNLFNVEKATRYYIKAGDLLSDIFTISVYEAPKIKRIDLTYVFPDYTGLSPKKVTDTGDVWAPVGTKVKIQAVADKKIRNSEVIVGENIRLKAYVHSDTLISTSFTVTHDTYYKIRITDLDNLTNDPPQEYYVHAIPDEPPTLTVEKPGHDIKASMLEEVPLKVKVEDDFGLSSLKLIYNLNDKPARVIPLKTHRKSEKAGDFYSVHEFVAEYMFYLEDLKVQPGDFITYYLEARDNSQAENAEPISTDIFFIEVRPFEQEFYQALSQGGMSGGMGGRLSTTQKEIITATWNLKKKKKQLNSDEFEDGLQAITESQTNLKTVTENVLQQMNQRSMFTRESGPDLTTIYFEAIEAMSDALKELEDKKLQGALTPERKAYQKLLEAEAQIKEIQVQRARVQGLAGAASLDEVAQLFEDEMDKLKNKYETLQQEQQRANNQQINKALEKLKELARRQQQFNQLLRDLARKKLTPEEKKRKIEELRRQQKQLQREAQQLNRQIQELRRRGARIPRDLQNKLRQASSDMNRTSSDLQRENLEQAVAQGQRALNRLKDLENRLKRKLNQSLRKQFEELEQEFQQLAREQKELTRDLEKQMQKSNKAKKETQEKLHKMREKQQRLKEEMTGLQKDLKHLSRQALTSKRKWVRDLDRLSRDLERAKIPQKMDSARQLLAEDRLNSALQAGQALEKEMEKLGKKMTRLREKFAETEAEKLDLALNQTQRLRENLENLQRETLEKGQAGARNNPDAKQTGRRRLPQNQGFDLGEGGPPPKLTPEQAQRWREELYRTLNDLQNIQNIVKVDTSLSRDINDISRQINGIVRNFGGGDPNKLSLIEKGVLTPLKNFEAELAQKLELLDSKEKLFMAREEKIPPGYETLVQKYYEAISETEKNK